MSVPDRSNVSMDTELTEQYVLNRTFDPEFNIMAVELLGYDGSANVLRRLSVGTDGGLTPALNSARYDIQSPVYYLGQGPVGADESDPVWTITKVDMTTNPYTSKIASPVSWTGRTGATYA